MIEYAKSQGIYTIVTDYLDTEKSYAKKIADESWLISTAETELIESKCIENHISALLCGISEFNLDQLIELCSRLNLPCYCTKEQRSFSKDKRRFKNICRRLSIPVADDYRLVELMNNDDWGFSVVVKPNGSAGSEGVSFCGNRQQLKEAYSIAEKKSEASDVIIERKLEGKEYFAVYAFADGEPRLVSLNSMNSQPEYPSKCYSFVISYADIRDRFLQELHPDICRLFKEMNYRNGAAWVQTILDQDGMFYLIEMGCEYRLPDMRYVNGFDFAKWQVNFALGNVNKFDCSFLNTNKFTKYACEYLFWTDHKGVVNDIKFETDNDSDDIKTELLVEKGSCFEQYQIIGHALFCANDELQVYKKLNKINSSLKVTDECGNNPIIYYTDNYFD